ncbi:MAG TPA: metallophosphoesterase [Acidimicrobiales bacterium]|nr:metallophosphoesterase [Acidimicrobiales bacterium]
MRRPARAGHRPRLRLFAVDDQSVQVTWAALPVREVSFEIAGQIFEVDAARPDWYRVTAGRTPPAQMGGPGALTVEGLEPATTYEVLISGPGRPRQLAATVRTAPLAPVGRAVFRFATISDMHVGERHLGPTRRLHDPRPRPAELEPYALRTTTAAIAEARAWGAELLVVKGDLTYAARPSEAATVADALAGANIPVHAILGNHDVRGRADVAAVLAERGIAVHRHADQLDVPALRLLFGHTPVPGLHGGRLAEAHARELAQLAGDADGPVALIMHHPPRRLPVQTYYPPSISWRDSNLLLHGLSARNRAALMLAGHTHRNRLYRTRGVTVAEVGSTKDYPGQWAGYTVYERGIRQVVRRTARPDVIAWTEMTSRAVFGVWGWWSPGRLRDRCWVLEWPDRLIRR